MNASMIPPTRYYLQAEYLRAIDADTVEVHVYVTPQIVFQNVHVRITSPNQYYDAPERNTSEGKAAIEFFNSLLKARSWVLLVVDAKRVRDSFGRLLACIRDQEGDDLASEMIAAGHVKKKPAFE